MRTPSWQKTIENDYEANICNAFMLTGNIGDYAKDTVLLRDYLIDWAISRMKFKDVIRKSTGDISSLFQRRTFDLTLRRS